MGRGGRKKQDKVTAKRNAEQGGEGREDRPRGAVRVMDRGSRSHCRGWGGGTGL